MSCYIMHDRALSGLAKAIDTVENAGFDYCGFSGGSWELSRALYPFRKEYGNTPTAIFKALADLNARAYAGRYKEPVDLGAFVYDPAAPEYLHPIQHDAEHIPIFTPEHYQLLKSLDCYLYQTNEDATRQTDLYKGLQEIRQSLAAAIITNRPEYRAATWG